MIITLSCHIHHVIKPHPHLRYGAEIEYTLVAYSREVLQNIWYVLEGIGDEMVETLDGLLSVLQLLEVC